MATSPRFDIPDTSALTEDGKRISLRWLQWVQRIHTLATTLNQSGATSERPTKGLYVGRFYFDTTLGKPIWVRDITPSVLWVDGNGTPS